MIAMMFRSGFLPGLLLASALILFAKVSIDQSVVSSIVFSGDMTDEQLADLRATLADRAVTFGEPGRISGPVEQLDWVNRVNIRREWPSTFLVEVQPELVVAYWNDDGFISHSGEVLYTKHLTAGDLPLLYGPAGTESDVMERYQQLGRMLSRHGFEIRLLQRTDRGAWTIETSSADGRNRIKVLLGKDDLKARMERFLEVAGELRRRGDERDVERMDARYFNGVAVQFAEAGQATDELGLGSL